MNHIGLSYGISEGQNKYEKSDGQIADGTNGRDDIKSEGDEKGGVEEVLCYQFTKGTRIIPNIMRADNAAYANSAQSIVNKEATI